MLTLKVKMRSNLKNNARNELSVLKIPLNHVSHMFLSGLVQKLTDPENRGNRAVTH